MVRKQSINNTKIIIKLQLSNILDSFPILILLFYNYSNKKIETITSSNLFTTLYDLFNNIIDISKYAAVPFLLLQVSHNI